MSTFSRMYSHCQPDESQRYGLTTEQIKTIMHSIYARGDRIMLLCILAHMILALCFAPVYGTWLVTEIVTASAVSLFGSSLLLLPRSFLTRCMAGIALQTFCALHIYQLHGLAEMHFFFFTAFTAMIVYQDWRSMWPGALLIIGQHILFASLMRTQPQLYFFEDTVTAQKLFYHFSIALVEVGLCGRWAFLLRQQTLRDAAQQAHLRQQTEELQAAKQMLQTAYQKEQHIAQVFQRTLLIEPETDRFPGLTLTTLYQAARDEAQIGGDFYDMFALDSVGTVALMVGDASGKGLAAATRISEVKFALRAFLRECPNPAVTLQRLNNYLLDVQQFDAQPLNQLICLGLCVFNTRSGQATFAIAGAEPPLILHADGCAREVNAAGMPLGACRETHYDDVTLYLEKGEGFILVTDGLTEARRGHEFYGYDRFLQSAQAAARAYCFTGDSGSSLPALARITQEIQESAIAFAGGKLQDDLCLLLAQRQ